MVVTGGRIGGSKLLVIGSYWNPSFTIACDKEYRLQRLWSILLINVPQEDKNSRQIFAYEITRH